MRKTQCGLIHTESKRLGLPDEFLRFPVRWLTARGPDGLLVRSLSIFIG